MFEGAAKGGRWVVSGTNSMTLVGKSRTNEQPLLQPWTSCHWGFGHAVKRMREEQMADSRQKGLIEGVFMGGCLGTTAGRFDRSPIARTATITTRRSTTTRTPGTQQAKQFSTYHAISIATPVCFHLPTVVIYGLNT